MAKNKFNLNIVLIALWAATLLFGLNLATAQAHVAHLDTDLMSGRSNPNTGPITSSLVLAGPPSQPQTPGGSGYPLPNKVEVGQAILVHDPATPDIAFWFPATALTEPVEVKSYRAGLPSGVNPLINPVSSPFFFGAWVLGAGRTIDHFDTAVLIHIPYDDSTINPIPEEQLRMMLYIPALQGWTRLCGAVDVHANVVSGLLLNPTPLEPRANALLGLSLTDTPPLTQSVNDRGVTTVAAEREDFRFYVQPDTIREGVYFEITSLPRSLNNNSIQLISDPVDLKACAVNHVSLPESSQLTQFAKPFRLEFGYTADLADRAGGEENLTIVTLQRDQWINVEDLGLRLRRNHTTISVDVDYLGTFSLAVR